MRASVSYKLDFTGVELDENDLLGQPDEYYRQPYFSGGALRFAAVQLGEAEALFEATRSFLASMGRTDDPFQRTRVAGIAWLIESGNQWLKAAGAKTDAWQASGVEAEGARGLMRPLPFERIHRDLTVYLRQPAPDASSLDIGRYVLDSKQPANDLWR